jgi:hypothetical protein
MEISEIDEIQIFDLDMHSARYCMGKGMVVVSDMKGVPDFRKLTLKRVNLNGDLVTFKVIMEPEEPTAISSKK